ncbi:hypothetical protein D3C78_1307330 [compost metagenome]
MTCCRRGRNDKRNSSSASGESCSSVMKLRSTSPEREVSHQFHSACRCSRRSCSRQPLSGALSEASPVRSYTSRIRAALFFHQR